MGAMDPYLRCVGALSCDLLYGPRYAVPPLVFRAYILILFYTYRSDYDAGRPIALQLLDDSALGMSGVYVARTCELSTRAVMRATPRKAGKEAGLFNALRSCDGCVYIIYVTMGTEYANVSGMKQYACRRAACGLTRDERTPLESANSLSTFDLPMPFCRVMMYPHDETAPRSKPGGVQARAGFAVATWKGLGVVCAVLHVRSFNC